MQFDRVEKLAGREGGKNERPYKDSANVMIVLLDYNGFIIRLNKFGEKLTGYNAIEVEGKNWFALFIPPEDRDEMREVHRDVWNGAGSWMGTENPILTKDRNTILMRWDNYPLRAFGNRMIATISMGEQVDEDKDDEGK